MTKTETRLRAELDELLAQSLRMRTISYRAMDKRSARMAEIRRILKGFDDEWAKRLRDAQKKGGL